MRKADMYIIRVRGVVQGVGFRPSVARAAASMEASGYVRNDGSHVTIACDMEPARFMEGLLPHLGPMARVEDWSFEEVDGELEGPFRILPSVEGEMDSPLPPDTAICDRCLRELTDRADRRFLYPFTNCTDCGARYTVIDSLPYDRQRTSMKDFPMCSRCQGEYSDQGSRRFHAQTISCPDCGPRYRFLGSDLEVRAEGWDSFLECARSLKGGGRLIVKGWGGMHIICDPANLGSLREWYGRPYKPFALMARDLSFVESAAHLPDSARKALISPARPIVLLKKRDDAPGWVRSAMEMASPGLDSIGIYLPYSGIHHLLFRALGSVGADLPWIVMTSANPPGEPMALDVGEASKLGADGYLVHDRRISARCDDSVLVSDPFGDGVIAREGPFSIRGFPVRKARGLVPDPLEVPHGRKILSFGAERNVTVTVTREGRAYTSPYVGNTRHPEVVDYTLDSAGRFMYLFGAGDVEAVACDLHPRYETVKIAREMADERSVPLIRIQHHRAHAASLMVGSAVEGMGVIVVDGVGYGDDGLSWGGEIFHASWEDIDRVGHLQYFGLPGGDASVYHPERIAHWLSMEAGSDLDIGDEKVRSILAASHSGAVMTSSMGRLLDALSALLLGVTWRSYDGEPAMRLESLLSRAREPEIELFSLPVRGREVDVVGRWRILLEELFVNGSPKIGDRSGDRRSADLAMGMVRSIISDMVEVGMKGVDDNEGKMGISGGVAYDIPILEAFVEEVKARGMTPVLHSRVPPGDGGISVGQAALAGRML
ncbi:MAG: carbamoyltransferase HypF [Thermoplasmata archaeon]|nr:MAG: carbamoyltransferase HypF [Thermoplasmata archaeon]